jgi:alkylhydroperoxidase family enzyme
MLALIAVFLAAFVDWSSHLNRGERGVVLVVAADKNGCGLSFATFEPSSRARRCLLR